MTNASSVSPLSIAARPEATGGRRVGVVLSHGFTGSPASMRPWAEYLGERGYGVELPLLPGHGTRWQDLNRTGWEDWYGEVARAYNKVRAEHDTVVVAGLSMGGALVLRLAADHPDQVAGVVLVNPMVATYRKDIFALPLLKLLVPAFPGIINDIKKPGQDEVGYPKAPLKAAHSMFSSCKALCADLPQVTAPLLMFRSTVDHVVDGRSAPTITGAVSSREVTERSLPNSYHVATLDNDAQTIFAESADFVARVTA